MVGWYTVGLALFAAIGTFFFVGAFRILTLESDIF